MCNPSILFQVNKDTEKCKRNCREKLKVQLHEGGVKTETRIYISLPSDKDHETVHHMGNVSSKKQLFSLRYLYQCLENKFTNCIEKRDHFQTL